MPRAARATWIVAGVALALQLLYVAQLSHTPYYEPKWLDPLFYYGWAGEIAAGHWLGDRIFFQSPLCADVLAYRDASRSNPTTSARGTISPASCTRRNGGPRRSPRCRRSGGYASLPHR